MSLCVNTHSKEFRDTVKRLNISEGSLENIVHEYMNSEGNGQFPSDSIILSKIEPVAIKEATKKSYELWRKKYNQPIPTATFEDAQAVQAEATKYFPSESVKIKETQDGKYEVNVGKFSTEALKSIATTPIKEEYRGRLIFAQSGTGKTSIADNINVIDSDYILGQVLGVPTALAGDAFKLLDWSKKIEVGNKYRELIRQNVAEGKTVITANLNMLPEADVVVYNESTELTNERTSADDRGNRFVNEEYQRESLERIQKYVNENPTKEKHTLGKGQFLSDVILNDRDFNVFTDRVRNNSLNELLNDFMHNFGINIEEYHGEMPLFDALNRVIKATSAEDIPNVVGEAVAFMMQYNPDIKRFIAERIVEDGKASREELFDEEGNVKHKYNTTPFAQVKEPYFKEVGNIIAEQLRRLYTESQTVHKEEVKDTFIKKIWDAISEFFNNLFSRRDDITALKYAQDEINNFAKRAARNILANNEGLIIASLSKPGKSAGEAELAVPVNVAEAIDNNPYERNILQAMSDEGIALAGSTSIAAFATVLRPAENPLHDMDFQAPGKSKEEIEAILKKNFGNFVETNTIANEEGIVGTRSYLVLSRPFHFEDSPLGKSFQVIVDNETGEHLGNLKAKTELTLNEGVNGKVLDFFVEDSQLAPMPYNYKDQTFLMGNPKQALSAKISWMRIKDVFDFNRAVPYDFTPTSLSENLNRSETVFNIEGKSIKEFLRDKGLIHTYDPSMGEVDHKAMYVTKGDGTYSMAANINEIYTTLRRYGISPSAVSFTRTANAVRIDFNSVDKIDRSIERNIQEVKKVVDFLQARIPALKGRVHYVTKEAASKVLGRPIRKSENSFVKGGQVYLVGRRFTTDIAVEECLHPFTATLKYENPFLYNRLAYEAMESFPKLWESIVANYTAEEGFSHEDRVNELVTQALARNFREEYKATEDSKRKTFNQYVRDFISWFKNLFYRVNPMTGNQIVDLNTIKPDMTLRELAGLINTSDTEFSVGFEEKVRYNKERANINPEDAAYITETIVVPGMPNADLMKASEIWQSANLQDNASIIRVPYGQWKALDVVVSNYISDSVALAPNKTPIVESSLTALLKDIEEWDTDIDVHYDKATKSMVMPKAVYDVARLIQLLKPVEKEIIRSLADYGYNINSHMFNLSEAISICLITEGLPFEDFLRSIGGEFYYSDSRQGKLFDDAGKPVEAKPSTINIYAGAGENTELSNFATRPFTLPTEFKLPNGKIFSKDALSFTSVEQAFQLAKIAYTNNAFLSDKGRHNQQLWQSILNAPNAAEARKLGRQIQGLNTEEWDKQSADVMKELIKASFEQNPEALQKLLATGDTQLTHTQDKSKWATEFPRVLMEVREELSDIDGEKAGLSAPKPLRERPELVQYQNATAKMITQLNNLLDSDLMSNSEVRHVAEQAVYFISDSITEFLEDPQTVFDAFPELAVKNGNPMTAEEKAAEAERIKNMSRVELAKYITPERLIEFTKYRMFTAQGNPNIVTKELRQKARLIKDNFEAVIRFANDAFTLVEDFSISSTGDNFTIEENLTPVVEDFDNSDDTDEILENEGSLQEHWQIESRTKDVIASMSKLVKQALNKCFQMQVVDGVEQQVLSDFGIPERMNAKDATASILRWTRGAESLTHMIEMLEAKADENPWIKQIISRLRDNSGNEADFQSQFYGVFAKAFQSYSVVLKEKNDQTGDYEYKSIPVNQHPALTDATQAIEVAYKTNNHPLFDNGKIRKDALDALTAVTNSLIEQAQHSLEEVDRATVIDLFNKAAAALGYTTDENAINLALDSTDTFQKMVNKLKGITDNLSKALTKENYDPFKYSRNKEDLSIGGFLRDFLRPLTEKLEETAVSSFYDSGKMYQSYVTPSYLTVMMNHFTSDDARFQEWLNSEYGAYEWFKNPDGSWRNMWLEQLDEMSQEDRKKLFKHKVQLNFNKHNYMRNMSDVEYALSVLSEFFSEAGGATGGTIPVWYRVPMMSNKPSSEFIRMYSYTGDSFMKYMLSDGFSRIFQQELSRIQTVDIRGYNKKDANFIKNFDKNGKKFIMLDFFNKYLKEGSAADTELGHLINKAIEEGTQFDSETQKGLTAEENARMAELVNNEIITSMDAKANAIIAEWKANGVFEGAKSIANVGKDDAAVEQKLREFIWNDTFASMNILELTITDPAFYKDAEDLQKRLAQIHAPGIRANVEATDYKGNRITDGKFRTILLKDFDDFVSNIKDNLRIVFDRKLKELEDSGVSKDNSRYRAAVATYDNIIEQFNYINVADAQGYSSPTSYRKKAFIFGKWSRKSEDIYKKLTAGNYNYSDLQTAFQPLKPFVYGQIEKPAMDSDRRDIATPLTNLKVPVQFKNSEYLLIMADAILQGEDTGKPNLLRAVYEVMEESAERDPLRGIDTIQFESTCKSGLMAPIDIKQYYNMQGGETMAKLALEAAIYKEDGSYNTDTYVYEVPFENYAIQQEVPEHFKEHYQAHGSQIRYIIPSDLESVDSEGNPVTYDYFDRGEQKKLTAEEFKKEYEENIAANIDASLNDLAEQMGLYDPTLSRKDRNIALSQVLLKEILSSPRYGVELAVACTVNSETGEFNIPLGDPIQSKRIEQLINSIVKNRVNKQEIAGGPVVQVSNFGTSKELNIRFKNKNGGLLMTKAEFAKTAPQNGKTYDVDAAYKKYIEDNQAGIAYYEVFAPIFSNELFEKFADKNGNIDIETIEMINPDLLKMIGYRIPTEDKYSMAPLKIVGFLPREAGDGIMLPNDITLLTGSDFDVDKFYLMRKEINIAMRIDTPNSVTDSNFEQAVNEFTKRHSDEVRKYLRMQINVNELTLDAKELREVNRRADEYVSLAIDAENKRHEARLEQIEEDATDALIAFDERESNEDLMEGQEEKAERKVEKGKDKQIAAENKYHERNLAKQQTRRDNFYAEEVEKAKSRKANKLVSQFLAGDKFAKAGDEITQRLKRAYVNYMFDYIEETEGTTYRNNKVVDMSWAVLTNETTASKMLTPGGFEPEKRMGYLVSAYQNPAVNMSWEELNAIQDIDRLKSLCYTDKNLCFINTHLQFYRQNAAAATALGMAAVQKVAHAVLESNGFHIDVEGALSFRDGDTFSIAGKEFGGRMEIDTKYNDDGELIGRTLGEFVAMFADAVKDPVANLMNINNTTMPIVTTLIRFGMPFNKAALFISQPAIKRVLELYNSENVTNFVRLSDVIQREINKITERFGVEKDSRLNEFNSISEQELIENMNPQERRSNPAAADVSDYKVLKFFQYVDTLSKTLKSPTYATRFNSISNAVGPLVIDNLTKEFKAESGDFKHFYDADGRQADISTIMRMHPILGSFYQTLAISRTLLDQMPANSLSFRRMLSSADSALQRTLYGDRKTLSELSDFYQSYLLIASGAIPLEATAENKHQGLKYYIEQFPADFIRGNAKELFKGNPLIDAIKLDIQKGRAILKVDTVGLTTQDKEKLGDGWADLYKSGERGKKLAEHLFYYNFWRTGIGFSPKSFMNLFPTRLKSKISGYNDTFTINTNRFARGVVGEVVLDQFAANNADNNKLAPKLKIGNDGVTPEVKEDNYNFSPKDYDKVKDHYYIKLRYGNRDILLKKSFDNQEARTAQFVEVKLLGNNGEYFEASLNPEYAPLTETTETKQQNNEGQMEQISNNQVQIDDVAIPEKPTVDVEVRRATKIRDMLLNMFMMSGRTEEEAKAKMEEFKNKTPEEQKKLEIGMKKFIANKFDQINKGRDSEHQIRYDEKLLDEMYNELC